MDYEVSSITVIGVKEILNVRLEDKVLICQYIDASIAVEDETCPICYIQLIWDSVLIVLIEFPRNLR